MPAEANYLTFTIGSYQFGLPAVDVLEINRSLEYTNIPQSAKSIRGILNLRGQLVPVIDMRHYLNIDMENLNSETTSIILNVGSQLVSLLVDRVGDIIFFEQSAFEPPPNNLSNTADEAIVGAYKLPNGLIIILDTKAFTRARSQEPSNMNNNLPATA